MNNFTKTLRLVGVEFFNFGMDEKKIEIEVVNTAQDYRRVLFQQQWKRVVLIAIIYLLIIVPTLWLTMFGAGANPFESKNNDIVIVMILFGLLPILMAANIYFGVWKQADKVSKMIERAKYTFAEQGIETVTDSSSSQNDWSRLSKIRETKKDFILYPQENVFFVIPKRFYKNETQIEEFRNLVREKLGGKAKLKG